MFLILLPDPYSLFLHFFFLLGVGVIARLATHVGSADTLMGGGEMHSTKSHAKNNENEDKKTTNMQLLQSPSTPPREGIVSDGDGDHGDGGGGVGGGGGGGGGDGSGGNVALPSTPMSLALSPQKGLMAPPPTPSTPSLTATKKPAMSRSESDAKRVQKAAQSVVGSVKSVFYLCIMCFVMFVISTGNANVKGGRSWTRKGCKKRRNQW
jgi:hypothetical protein